MNTILQQEDSTYVQEERMPVYWEGTSLEENHLNIDFVSDALIYMLIFLALLAWVRLRGNGILSSLYLFFFKRKRGDQMFVDMIRPGYFFFFILHCMSFSILAVLFSYLFHEDIAFPESALFFVLLWGYHLLFIGLIKLFGWTYDATSCSSEIVANFLVYNAILGLSLSPLMMALFFIRQAMLMYIIYMMIGVLFICLIFKFIRLIKILFEYRVSIFYMILYLCALEILPFLLLYKFLG